MYSNLDKKWYILYFTCVPLVWSIIYIVVSCFTSYFYYNDLLLQNRPFLKFIISISFYFCAFMTFYCHIKSMLTNPGTLVDNMVNRLNNNEKTFCKKCNKNRPLRAHHCSTCGKCILKMDHHCPWIFNCVGYYNQKSFLLFLFYGTIGDAIATPCIFANIFLKRFIYLIFRPMKVIDFNSDYLYLQLIKELKEPIWIIVSSCISIAITISVGSLFITQMFCLFNNVTNVESTIYDNDENCPFYAKTHKFFMFKTVVGMDEKWKWFFPIFKENKYNNGYTFDTPYKRIVKVVDKDKDKKMESKSWFCCC